MQSFLYHDLCGDIMSTLGDVQYIGVFNINFKMACISELPHMHHDIYAPDVLICSHTNHDTLMY